MPEIRRSACPLDCPDACTLDVEVEGDRVVAVRGSHVNPVTDGFICGKVARIDRHLYGPERVLTPLLRAGARGEGRWTAISWDEALDRSASALRELAAEHGPRTVLPCTYGGSNGYLTQDSHDLRFFTRLGASRILRTLCAMPSGRAQVGLYGKMPGVALTDYVHARLIVVWGCNPHATGIHLVPRIKEARARGARLVVVDPRRTSLARQADLHLAVRPGTDLPVALALLRWLFASGRADRDFLARRCTGVAELERRVQPWTLEAAASEAGLDPVVLEAFARLYADSDPAVIRCGWGVERNRNGGAATAAILALPAVGGKFTGRAGGYTMSNTGAWALDSERAAGVDGPPTRDVNLCQLGSALTELQDPRVHMLFVYNCNPLATVPDQEAVRRGLMRDDLFTVVHDAVMTDTATLADLVLPATTFLENDELTRGYGSLILNRARPAAPAPGEARSNAWLFDRLLERMGLDRPDDAVDADSMTRAILEDAEEGQRLAEELAECGAAIPAVGLHPVQLETVQPRTAGGTIDLVPESLDAECPGLLYDYAPDPATEAYPLALISPASTRTISSTFGQLVTGPARLLVHPEDARERELAEGAMVRIFNELGEVHCPVQVSTEVRPGVVLLPKGLWARRTANGATSNSLIPATLTDLGGGGCFNDARVQVEALA